MSILTRTKSTFTAMFCLSTSNTGGIITSCWTMLVMLMLLSSVAANKPKIISPNYEPLPDFCGKRFLTTYLTITGFGAHGGSGDESSKEQIFRNKRYQKGAENVRKKIRQLFGTRRPWVQVPQPGPSPYAIIDTMVVYGDLLLLLQYTLILVIS